MSDQDNTAPEAAPATKNVVVVDPQLLQETLRVLQEELPMSKVRTLVQALEASGIAQVPVNPK